MVLAFKGLASKGTDLKNTGFRSAWPEALPFLVTHFRFSFRAKYCLLALFRRCWLLFLLSHWLVELPRVCVSLVNLSLVCPRVSHLVRSGGHASLFRPCPSGLDPVGGFFLSFLVLLCSLLFSHGAEGFPPH